MNLTEQEVRHIESLRQRNSAVIAVNETLDAIELLVTEDSVLCAVVDGPSVQDVKAIRLSRVREILAVFRKEPKLG